MAVKQKTALSVAAEYLWPREPRQLSNKKGMNNVWKI
jgi:hypothetical protein